MPEAMLRGRRVQYRSWGEDRPGTPVLLAHCSLAHSGLWKPIAEALAEDRPVIAPDMPAHGRSDPPPEGESLQIFASEMLAMLAEGFGRKAHLVGLSLGGAAQSRVARARPELAASLTMIEPVLFHLLHKPGEEPPVHDPDISDEALGKALDEFIGAWGAPGRVKEMTPDRRAYFLRCYRELRLDNAWVVARPEGQIELPDFARMAMPVFLLGGADSQADALRVLDAIKGVLPGARRRDIPGAGHMSPVTHWQDVLAELRGFFAAVEADAAAVA
ncbi:MAG: alpha/beta fold hydrolase [Pseudomonadota bacterium]|nr:alpha/beta fold hydrolase [Pseudomonadota bacterium]MEE3101700.1 alpha/beta fold hydrolase [Pseudomonadota bacterium]